MTLGTADVPPPLEEVVSVACFPARQTGKVALSVHGALSHKSPSRSKENRPTIYLLRPVHVSGFPAPTGQWMVGLSAARIHGPPGPVELPGVDAPFVSARISADRPHSEGYDDKSGIALSGAYLSPVCCNAVRSSEGAMTVSSHGGLLPAASLRPCPRPNGSEGNGIGNARGIPPCGARRRHLFGCQGVGPAFPGPDGPQQRHNQRHIPGARPVRAMSVRPGVDYLLDKAEARARVEYST